MYKSRLNGSSQCNLSWFTQIPVIDSNTSQKTNLGEPTKLMVRRCCSSAKILPVSECLTKKRISGKRKKHQSRHFVQSQSSKNKTEKKTAPLPPPFFCCCFGPPQKKKKTKRRRRSLKKRRLKRRRAKEPLS